jgi:hypothetical protein
MNDAPENTRNPDRLIPFADEFPTIWCWCPHPDLPDSELQCSTMMAVEHLRCSDT